MQSFSKGTEKQAEHNLLMWITYLIIVALATATVVWWYQTPSAQPAPVTGSITNQAQQQNISKVEINSDQDVKELPQDVTDEKQELVTLASSEKLNQPVRSEASSEVRADNSKLIDSSPTNASVDNALAIATPEVVKEKTIKEPALAALTHLVFTFTGDCWVNIYDANGERVAWGVKKSGYIMRFSGQAPFSVTLGKPELVQIKYNDVAVDMTGFNAGNIAKFSLPIKP
jgi:cytoskeleton protein RodZ